MEETEEKVEETINFVIDESKSTTSSKFIIRKRKVVHKTDDTETFVELFEDTFTIPLHKFNLNLILSQTKVHNIEETVITDRNIQRHKLKDDTVEIEQLNLPVDTINLESVLPMIDYNDIDKILLKEERKQIIKKKKKIIKGEQSSSSEDIPDLETVSEQVFAFVNTNSLIMIRLKQLIFR